MIQLKNPPQVNEEWLKDWQELCRRPEAGFTRLGQPSAEWTAIDRRAAELSEVKNLAILGIGGSSLGTQVIVEALGAKRMLSIEFLESPDPLQWERTRERLTPETHYLIVSKSGSTLETLAWAEKLGAEGRLAPKNCTVIASPGQGPLHQWAAREKVAVLTIPADVGGRFSVLTAVGMLPAALLGWSADEFRQGAEWALARPELAAGLAEAALASWRREEWITQLWSFSVGLRAFGEWWQQLWAESLAKKLDRQGKPALRVSSPMACTGPRDQHSVAQQLIEGARDKSVIVTRLMSGERDPVKFKSKLFSGMVFSGRDMSLGGVLSAEAEAFERALAESGIHFTSLQVEELSAQSLGGLFMLWQMTIALLGERLGLNPFDQPGVELGKKHAAQILSNPNIA